MNKIISMELLTDSAKSKIAASRKELIPIYLSVFGTESAFSLLFYRQFVVLGVKEPY